MGLGESLSFSALWIIGIPVPLPSVNPSSFKKLPIRLFLYLLVLTTPFSKSDSYFSRLFFSPRTMSHLRRQNRMTIWLQQMHLGIHQLPGHGFIEEKPYPCTASAVIFMSRALQARGSVDGSVIVVRKWSRFVAPFPFWTRFTGLNAMNRIRIRRQDKFLQTPLGGWTKIIIP